MLHGQFIESRVCAVIESRVHRWMALIGNGWLQLAAMTGPVAAGECKQADAQIEDLELFALMHFHTDRR